MSGLVYGSICSGIEAATVAWHPLGWEPAFFSEIDKFPRHVLSHHYPRTPLHGDFTTIKAEEYRPIDLLVGGTPCQSFSVAGKRLGLDDPRGNLAIEYCRLALRLKPRWIVWENVPGVLSSNGGRDFGAFLGLLGECGYGWAYRVLDAQYVRVDGYPRAVPQRRRRVFVVGHLGDWRRAAAVLFEPEGLRGGPPPRREAGQGSAGSIAPSAFGGGNTSGPIDAAACLTAKGQRIDFEVETFVTTSSRDRISLDAFANGTNLPILFVPNAGASQWAVYDHEVSATLIKENDLAVLAHGSHAVRRLTPRECERLQGFPDSYTDVPWRGKNWTPDGPRYKALGNSMAVNVMRWIGRRIEALEQATGGLQ